MRHVDTHQRREGARIVLITPVTRSDWTWKHGKRIGHGEHSIGYIFHRCKDVGWQRIYRRCLDEGQALYTSRLLDSVAVGCDGDKYHA